MKKTENYKVDLSKLPKTHTGAPNLMDLTQEQLMEVFKTLEAPSLDEFQGEFHSTKLSHHSYRDYWEWHLTCDNPLLNPEWVGKAFRKIDDEHGTGYNLFRHCNGKLYQDGPMYTTIAPSRYDGKPSFTLIYGAYKSMITFTQMVDEVRKVCDGTYLLIGTYRGVFKGAKMRPHFWLIEGPYQAYRGDCPNKAKKFKIEKQIPNYKKNIKKMAK